LHKPAEGGVMPGYAAAMADYKRRVGSDAIMVAGGGSRNSDDNVGGVRHRSLLAALFGGGGDETEQDMADASADDAPVAAPVINKKPVRQEAILTASAEPAPEPEPEINAPVPLLRPADEPSMETALLSTGKNPAEEAMQAALTPQPQDQQAADAQPEFVNLAKLSVPVPSLLGERKQPGDSQQTIVTASLDPSTMALLNAAPVPEMRPGDDNTASAKDDDIIVPAGDVNASEIAALAQQTGDTANDDTTDEEDSDIADSLDAPTKGHEKLAEMASIDVPNTSNTRSFMIAAPAAAEDEHKVVKGGRPAHAAALDAGMADPVIRTEPKLTKNLIAQWAISKGRMAMASKPVKAPRFVSNTMRKQPTEVYSDGFTQSAQIDPARFSGSAVNFMPVKKFPETN